MAANGLPLVPIRNYILGGSWVILETERGIRKIPKGHFFTTKQLKRAPLIRPPPMFIASLVQLF